MSHYLSRWREPMLVCAWDDEHQGECHWLPANMPPQDKVIAFDEDGQPNGIEV
jgi:hypothetical protein